MAMAGQRLFQVSVKECDGGWLLTDIVAAPSRRKAAHQALQMYSNHKFGPQDIGVRPLRAVQQAEGVAA